MQNGAFTVWSTGILYLQSTAALVQQNCSKINVHNLFYFSVFKEGFQIKRNPLDTKLMTSGFLVFRQREV